jgi:hypothetical protein
MAAAAQNAKIAIPVLPALVFVRPIPNNLHPRNPLPFVLYKVLRGARGHPHEVKVRFSAY